MKREKKHISKNTDIDQSSNIEIDRKFFRGKKVLVFDDICTSGKTSQNFIEQMEKAGAKVKMAMFLAKTKQVVIINLEFERGVTVKLLPSSFVFIFPRDDKIQMIKSSE